MDVENPDIALSFKNLGVSILSPPSPIITNVNGFVKKGGITAVLGASATGKSVLLKAIGGRIQNLHITGELICDGERINPYDIRNSIGYVPQDDFLAGEFTARETLTNNYRMKSAQNEEKIDEEVEELLKRFGLSHVADNLIGTIFFRGLSGGQRKRVEVCSELISPTKILLLDEPTSGLDGAIAYEILSVIKQILKARNGELSVILNIHQPNSRILNLFDHILLLGGNTSPVGSVESGNSMLFFGTVPESLEYFKSIGFNLPPEYTPTDVYLQLTDNDFGTNQAFDFEGTYIASKYSKQTKFAIEENIRQSKDKGLKEIEQEYLEKPTNSLLGNDVNSKSIESVWWRQYVTIVKRDFVLAFRDPSLYLLQLALSVSFGFMIGAAFFGLTPIIDNTINNVVAGLLWLVLPTCYLHVFKVYHLSRAYQRYAHEVGNRTYNIFVCWLAELTSLSVFMLLYIPATAISYFMMKLPSSGYPFLIINFWMTALTAESMLAVITKFSDVTTVSIVACQAALVILTVFGGGVFISWRDVPVYWRWLQEISVFTQSSRAAIVSTYDNINFSCTLNSAGLCIGPSGAEFPCDNFYNSSTGECSVTGRTVLQILQGTIRHESKWVPFGYLVLLFVCFRLGLLFLMYYPPKAIMYSIRNWWSGDFSRGILESIMGIRRVEREFHAYILNVSSVPFDEVVPMVSQEEKPVSFKGPKKALSVFDSALAQDKYEILFDDTSSKLPTNESQGSSLEWTDLSVVLPKGTVLIDNVSGIAQAGRTLALMGPSGAGKTTLLNALSRRAPYAKLSGQVTFGGRPMVAEDLVYVPQFDEFNGNLSVFEQIEFVGLMKCADHIAMRVRLAKLLRILGLADRRDSPCSSLTSGQLKRVSVGMGMISNPKILFLDEPTTGLDSSAAFSIVKHIAELSAITKVVVILTIHQPAQTVFDLLQDLYLLEQGRLAFFGPLKTTQKYFTTFGKICPEDVNPADFYLDLVNQSPGLNTTWGQLYSTSTFGRKFNLMIHQDSKSNSSVSAEPPPNEFTRFSYLVKFFFKYYTREIGFYYLRLVYLVIVALFCGTLFLQLKPTTSNLSQYSGSVFFSIWTVLFSAVAATGLLASDRRLALEQVKNAVMKPYLYCLAQFVTSIPFNFICALVFQGIFFWMVNLNPNGESFIYSVMLATEQMLMMESLMLTVVAILHNANLSVTFAMMLMGFLFLFSGFFILIPQMPRWIGWLSYICPTSYTLQGYLWSVFSTQDFEISGGGGATVTGEYLLKALFGLRDIKPWRQFGIMIGWIILFRFMHYGAFFYEVYPYIKKVSLAKQTLPINNKSVGDVNLQYQPLDSAV